MDQQQFTQIQQIAAFEAEQDNSNDFYTILEDMLEEAETTNNQ